MSTPFCVPIKTHNMLSTLYKHVRSIFHDDKQGNPVNPLRGQTFSDIHVC